MRTTATVLSFTLLSLSAAAARAADDNGPVFSGFVDTTYNYNFNGPVATASSPTGSNVGHTNDAQANTFNLNNAQLLLQGNPRGDKDVGYTLRLDYGTDAKWIDPSSSGLVEVEEAYGTYTCPDTKCGIKVGKFVTYEGIEVIESIADPTITRGLLFGMVEPFTHTGAVLTYTTGKFDFAAGLVNGWDLVTDNNNGKTVLFKGTYSGGDPLTLTLSGLYGPELAAGTAAPQSDDDNRLSLDLTGVTKVVQHLDLNFQLNFGSQEHANQDPAKVGQTATWFGLGIQPVYHVDKKFSIGARFEWLNIPDGYVPATTAPLKTKLTTFSICPAYQVTDHFLSRLELRYDSANKAVFDDRDGVAMKKHQFEVAAETIFTF